MKEYQRRRIGRPRLSGPEAEANPLSALSPEERRVLFLETAAKLFEEKGYSKTSVEDITRELGFTKGVFYYYWKNKREIVQEIHDRALEMINARLDGVIAEESSAAVRLETAIRNHVEAVLENRSIIAVLMGDFAFSEETLEGRRAYGRRFQTLVEEGIAAGVVREMDPKVLTSRSWACATPWLAGIAPMAASPRRTCAACSPLLPPTGGTRSVPKTAVEDRVTEVLRAVSRLPEDTRLSSVMRTSLERATSGWCWRRPRRGSDGLPTLG